MTVPLPTRFYAVCRYGDMYEGGYEVEGYYRSEANAKAEADRLNKRPENRWRKYEVETLGFEDDP
jgi:hypothetical protein